MAGRIRYKTLTVFEALRDYMADDQNVTLDIGGELVTGKVKSLLQHVDEDVLRRVVKRIGYGDSYNIMLYVSKRTGATDDAG